MHLPILFPLYFGFFSLVSAFDVTLQATYRKTNGDASVFVWLDDAQNNKVVEVVNAANLLLLTQIWPYKVTILVTGLYSGSECAAHINAVKNAIVINGKLVSASCISENPLMKRQNGQLASSRNSIIDGQWKKNFYLSAKPECLPDQVPGYSVLRGYTIQASGGSCPSYQDCQTRCTTSCFGISYTPMTGWFLIPTIGKPVSSNGAAIILKNSLVRKEQISAVNYLVGNFAMGGSIIGTASLGTREQCSSRCSSTPNCLGFTMDGSTTPCQIKSSITGTGVDMTRTSYVRMS